MKRNKPRTIEIVDVVNGVSDVIGKVHQLSFKALELARLCIDVCPSEFEVASLRDVEPPFRVPLTVLVVVALPGVLEKCVQGRPGEVEAAGLLSKSELRRDSKCLRVSLESDLAAEFLKFLLGEMPERGMPDIVEQTRGLYDVRVETPARVEQPLLLRLEETLGKAAAHLPHLERVREAVVKKVPLARARDLRYASESAKCRAVEDTIAIALRFGPRVFGRL